MRKAFECIAVAWMLLCCVSTWQGKVKASADAPDSTTTPAASGSAKDESRAKKDPLAYLDQFAAPTETDATTVEAVDTCNLCHIDVVDAFIGSVHINEGVACVDCHGSSSGHVADENNAVKPDKVFARADIDQFCVECHECSRAQPVSKPAGDRPVCTDCHAAHTLRPPEENQQTPATLSRNPEASRDSKGQAQEDTLNPPRYLRIGHYQCVCRQGDFHHNLDTVLHGLQLAADARLDIVSFPESLLTGYYNNRKEARANSFAIDSPEMTEVLNKTKKFESLFMVGFNEQRDDHLYNTVAVIEKGKILGRYSKAMPCYSYFTPGREFPVFEKKGLRFGVIICADGGYIEPARIVSLKGARVIFAPHFNFISDAVPHFQTVRSDHIARAVENGVYFLRANNVDPKRTVAGLKNYGFGYGDSYLLDPNGQTVAGAGIYQEALMIYNLDLKKTYYSQHNFRSRKSAAELSGILEDVLATPRE